MRVGIDGRSLRAARARRGVAVYLETVLAELARLFPEDEYRVLVPGEARPGGLPGAPNVELVSSRAPGILLNGSAAIAQRPRLDRLLGAPDLVWAPTIAPLALSRSVPFVLTVLDLSFTHRPGDYSAYERLWHRLARPRRLAERARIVLTISEAVRRQLLSEWQLAPERIRHAPLGPGRARDPAAAAQPPLPSYVLAVGALEPRKQPGLLVEAHRRARERGLRAGLLFAGDGPLRSRLERSSATVLGRVDDSELDSLYAGALCLACVSREEGFGFTPLEALAAGTPPVVAELDVFVETLGDAALRVPPGDPDALAGALLRLQEEPDLRQRIVAAGRERLAGLSWEQTARATRAAFEEALS